MTTDMFIKFDGIDGEAIDAEHKGEIEVLSWNWGVANTGHSVSDGGTVGKPQKQDFVFTHVYDKASPLLAKQCVTGKRIKSVVFITRKASKTPLDFLTITMKDVNVTSVQAGNSAGGESLESVSCDYRDIEFAYRAMTAKGSLEDPVKFGWNSVTYKIR